MFGTEVLEFKICVNSMVYACFMLMHCIYIYIHTYVYMYKLEVLTTPSTSGITQRETCIQATESLFSQCTSIQCYLMQKLVIHTQSVSTLDTIPACLCWFLIQNFRCISLRCQRPTMTDGENFSPIQSFTSCTLVFHTNSLIKLSN